MCLALAMLALPFHGSLFGRRVAYKTLITFTLTFSFAFGKGRLRKDLLFDLMDLLEGPLE